MFLDALISDPSTSSIVRQAAITFEQTIEHPVVTTVVVKDPCIIDPIHTPFQLQEVHTDGVMVCSAGSVNYEPNKLPGEN